MTEAPGEELADPPETSDSADTPDAVNDEVPTPPHTGQPPVDAALAGFVEKLDDGLDAHVEAGAQLDETLRAALQDLDPESS